MAYFEESFLNNKEGIVLSDGLFSNNSFNAFKVIITTDCGLRSYEGDNHVVAVVGSRRFVSEAAEHAFPSLKLAQLTSAGWDAVPLELFAKKGVAVANAGSVYSVPIAETVVFGMLSVAKKLRRNPNNRRPKFQRGYSEICELAKKRALIMGFGCIGKEVAKRLWSFDMTIDAYNRSRPECPYYERYIFDKKDLIRVLPDYDYIIVTLPDNEGTRGLINYELLSQMKRTAVIVNVGRKGVFVEEDLLSALKNKQIAGAVLDRFEKIPSPLFSKFRRLNNVIVLPGVAAISIETTARLNRHITNNLLRLKNSEPLSSVVNSFQP